MKPSLGKTHESRSSVLGALWLPLGFLLYVLSAGPVAWATNDGWHPRYLPNEVNWIYLPLAPFMKIDPIRDAFYHYTVIMWGGFPTGYTTL